MSINWVMLDSSTKNFVPLPREKVLFTSPNRTSLALQTPNSYPGKEPLSIKCGDGKAIITNQRLVYLPTTPSPVLQSFQSPILSLQDTHVSAPFFGPNVWEGVLIPTAGGGIPAHHNLVQIKLTFREGGAFDFSSTFERIKETLSQAADVARESGRTLHPGEVDLEQLPAYEEAVGAGGGGPRMAAAPTSGIQRPTPVSPNGTAHLTAQGYRDEKSASGPSDLQPRPPPPSQSRPPPSTPNEPPPGYEEAQESSVVSNLERRVSGTE